MSIYRNTPEENAVSRFVRAVIAWNQAVSSGKNIEVCDEIAKNIHHTFQDIRALGEPAQELLWQQTEHEDLNVVLMAASRSLQYRTDKALKVLTRLAKNTDSPQNFKARAIIRMWNANEYNIF